MPRKQKKYHYIYKTTNKLTGKYYIGMHSTDNLNDGYLGSGLYLRRSIGKYGKENFKLEILEMLPDRNSLKQREKQLVNEGVLNDFLSMNLKIGGEGGNLGRCGTYLGGDKFRGAQKYWESPENKERVRNRMREISKKLWNNDEYRNKMKNIKPMFGKKHSLETKKKIGQFNSINQKGKKNSQFGKPRSEETKEKIRKSINLKLGKCDELNKKERKKILRIQERNTYTFEDYFFNKHRRNKIKEIFNIDLESDFNVNIIKLKKLLYQLYVIENKSTIIIGKIFNTNSETIRNYLILFKIKKIIMAS